MIAFSEVHTHARVLIIILYLLTATGLIFFTTNVYIRDKSILKHVVPLMLIPPSLALLLQMIIFQKNVEANIPGIVAVFANIPFAMYIIVLILIAVTCIIVAIMEIKKSKDKITPDSIKEAISNLPSGLCISALNGIPLLTDRKMYELAEMLTGRFFRNAEEFWQQITHFSDQKHIELVENGDSPTFMLLDGTIWKFARSELVVNGDRYFQIRASDITELYTLSKELEKSNADLDKQYIRLKKLAEEIAVIKREEEILSSKISIHNELGSCILAGNLFIDNNSKGEGIDNVFELWEHLVKGLESSISKQEQEGDFLKQLIEASQTLGCSIEFSGDLPRDEELRYLLMTAVREAVTNAVRHSEANKVTVELNEQDGILSVEISDNGKTLLKEISEGSGLGNLRKKIEKTGGKMEVMCRQGVNICLSLIVGKEEGA